MGPRYCHVGTPLHKFLHKFLVASLVCSWSTMYALFSATMHSVACELHQGNIANDCWGESFN